MTEADRVRLTNVFLGVLHASGMRVPEKDAAEMIDGWASHNSDITEESVAALAQRLLAERAAEKPGTDVYNDPDTAQLTLVDVGRLVQALGVSGSVMQEGDAVVDSLRRHALGHLAIYGELVRARIRGGGVVPVPRSLLHRTSRTLRQLAEHIAEGAALDDHDEPIRDDLVLQVSKDADFAEELSG